MCRTPKIIEQVISLPLSDCFGSVLVHIWRVIILMYSVQYCLIHSLQKGKGELDVWKDKGQLSKGSQGQSQGRIDSFQDVPKKPTRMIVDDASEMLQWSHQ